MVEPIPVEVEVAKVTILEVQWAEQVAVVL